MSVVEEYVDGLNQAGELAPGAAPRLINLFANMAGHPPGAVAASINEFLATGHTRASYVSGKQPDPTTPPLRRELQRYAHRLAPGAIESLEVEIGPRAGRTPREIAAFVAGYLRDPRQRGFLNDPPPATRGHEAVRSACYGVWPQLRPEAPDRIATELWLEADRQRITDNPAALERLVARRLARSDAGKYTLSGEPLPSPDPTPAPARDTTAPPPPERGEASAAPRRTVASRF
jgi:hypothetical protein